jgi:hypothetical protein
MPKNSGHTKRDLFPATGAGKGDADRSPGWREHYDEIQWSPRQPAEPKRFRKVYGPATPRPDDTQAWRTVAPDNGPALWRRYLRGVHD